MTRRERDAVLRPLVSFSLTCSRPHVRCYPIARDATPSPSSALDALSPDSLVLCCAACVLRIIVIARSLALSLPIIIIIIMCNDDDVVAIIMHSVFSVCEREEKEEEEIRGESERREKGKQGPRG